jgi:predicted transcriptional regulator
MTKLKSSRVEIPPTQMESWGVQTKQSKLEMYLNILKVLRNNGPLTLNQIIKKANLEKTIFNKHIDFLSKQGMVEKRAAEANKVVFVVTQRGVIVLGYFKEFARAPPLVEEA